MSITVLHIDDNEGILRTFKAFLADELQDDNWLENIKLTSECVRSRGFDFDMLMSKIGSGNEKNFRSKYDVVISDVKFGSDANTGIHVLNEIMVYRSLCGSMKPLIIILTGTEVPREPQYYDAFFTKDESNVYPKIIDEIKRWQKNCLEGQNAG